MVRGSELLKQGKIDQAQRAFRAALEIDPDNIRVLALLGLAHFRAGELVDARVIYEQLVERTPTDASHRLNLGLVHLKLNDADRAIAALEASRALDPSQGRAVSYLGLAYARGGRYAEAYRSFLIAGQNDLAIEIESNLTGAERDRIHQQLGRTPQGLLPQGQADQAVYTPGPVVAVPHAQGPDHWTPTPAGPRTTNPIGGSRVPTPSAVMRAVAPATGRTPTPTEVAHTLAPAVARTPTPTGIPRTPLPAGRTPTPTGLRTRPPTPPTPTTTTPPPPTPTMSPTTTPTMSPTPAPTPTTRPTPTPTPTPMTPPPTTMPTPTIEPAAAQPPGLAPGPTDALPLQMPPTRTLTPTGVPRTKPPSPPPRRISREFAVPTESPAEARTGEQVSVDAARTDAVPLASEAGAPPRERRITDSTQFVMPHGDPAAPQQALDGPSMISRAVASAAPPAVLGGTRTRAGGVAPRPLSELATDELVRPDDGDDAFEIAANGALILRVTERVLARLDGVHVTGGDLAYEPAMRRSRGHHTGEAFDHGGSPLHTVTGRGYLIAVPGRHAFSAVMLDDDILYLREDLVFAFQPSLRWENGNVPGLRGRLPIVQFRGDGALVMRLERPLVRIKLTAQGTVFVDAGRLAGWIGRVIPRAVVPPAGGPLGAMCVECTGEGIVLVEPRAADAALAAATTSPGPVRTAEATPQLTAAPAAGARPPEHTEPPEPPDVPELRELRETHEAL